MFTSRIIFDFVIEIKSDMKNLNFIVNEIFLKEERNEFPV